MVYEMAQIRIDPEKADEFETEVSKCIELFRAAPGCRSMLLERQVEDHSFYTLRLGWNELADHVVRFRASDAFQEWRRRAGPFFLAPPTVVHHELAVYGFDDREEKPCSGGPNVEVS